MQRHCAHCQQALTPRDFHKEESKDMERERKARGLDGMRFLYYACSQCGHTDIFVELHHLPEETDEAFQQRRQELEATARQLHAEGSEVVVAVREPR